MNLFNFLSRAASDGQDPSSMRTIAMLCVPLIVVLPILVWAGLSIHARALLDFPPSVTGYVPVLVGAILGALHLNKREESK